MSRSHTWPPPELKRLETQLDSLTRAVEEGSERDIDEQIWLTRFLIIRACGYLEQVVHATVIGHIQQGSYGTARSFALSWLERSRNPSRDNLVTTLGRLDAELSREFEELLERNDKEFHQNLYLLVGRRHQIAHGENEGLSSQKAISLTKFAKELADWFILRLNPNRTTSRQQS